MSTNQQSRYNPSYDIESRKKGPFSIFILSYELPAEPTTFATQHGRHQYTQDLHRERKSIAREWHKNPNRRRSVPANVLV